MDAKCNITTTVLQQLDKLRWGYSCNASDTPIIENYIEQLNCACLKFIPLNVVECNNPTTIFNFTKVYWGWKNNSLPLTLAEIEASLNFAYLSPGSVVKADFRANGSPMFLWVAIPVGEPVGTNWYGADNNKGKIGTSDDFIAAPIVIQAKYNLYFSNYPSQQQDTVIEIRH